MTAGMQGLAIAATAAFGVAAGLLAYVFATAERTQVKQSGERGYARQRAREESLLFGVFEPVIRMAAAWLRWIPFEDQRRALDKSLSEAGEFLGLDADEFVAMSLLCGLGTGLVFYLVTSSATIGVGVGALCTLLPTAGLQSRTDERAISISRELPQAIDILALCVSAGMDFPGAIRELIGVDAKQDDPLRSEMRRMLRDMDLGHSRKQALLAFEDRAKGEGVREFVASVIQSEEKGNPLAEVLAAQATMLRMRRSNRAEIMASKAGIKLAIPLGMLMMGLMVLIIAPLLLKMKEFGM